MRTRPIALPLLALTCALLPACFTMPLHTTARTLPEGRYEFALAPVLGLRTTEVNCRNPPCEELGVMWAPWPGAAVRYGLADGIELGARASWGFMLDGKVRLFDGERLALALGLAAGWQPGQNEHFLKNGRPLVEAPLLVEFGRRDGWRLALGLKWAAAFESTTASGWLLEDGPGFELALDSGGDGWGVRPFVFGSLGRTTRIGGDEPVRSSAWQFAMGGAGVAVTWR